MMHLIRKLILLFVALFVFLFTTSGQFRTMAFKENVKTLQINRSDNNIDYPVIYSNREGETITISFDLTMPEMHQITYSIIHCDADWMHPSDLSANEYLDGFQDAYVNDYNYSQSTNIDYVNYRVELPNEDVQLNVSGNYAVIFYDEDDQDTLLTACFSIVEPLVEISGSVDGISTSGGSNTKQQLNFTINHSNYTINQPLTETKVIVKQNNNAYNPIISSTPTYIHPNELVFNQNPQFCFPGGDEYHILEVTNVHFSGKGIAGATYYAPFYHINVHPGQLRQLEKYSYNEDINGRFVVRRQDIDEEDYDFESDYLVVHFSVPMQMPILDGKVYVSGDFNYNILNETTQMTYNTQTKSYEAYFMLKQGYYNYRYYVVSNRNEKIKSAPIELDAHQTENDYQIFFYHRPIGERYDHLVGYKVINSLK